MKIVFDSLYEENTFTRDGFPLKQHQNQKRQRLKKYIELVVAISEIV